jgi:hypothetical protein
MKPSWNDAPEWANYLARDKNCDWNWFQELPYIDEKLEEWISPGARWRFYFLGTCEGGGWRNTLEKRPNV